MIPFLDLTRQHTALQPELMDAVARVLASSRFVLGPEGQALETELAALAGVRHGMGVGSGTDALRLALTAVGVGPGDEVVTPAFSFVASASTIVMAGAQPVFVDIDPATFALDPDALESALTRRTRAIIVVHLYGHPGAIDRIAEIARRRGVPLIEDAAQAIGATRNGKSACSLGFAGCLSFYPTKNLGAFGDAGAICTNNDAFAEKCRKLRVHGSGHTYHHEMIGGMFRIAAIQAAVLNVKLK